MIEREEKEIEEKNHGRNAEGMLLSSSLSPPQVIPLIVVIVFSPAASRGTIREWWRIIVGLQLDIEPPKVRMLHKMTRKNYFRYLTLPLHPLPP